MKITSTEKQEAIESLKTLLSPGQTVYTILRSVSSSGLSRSISAVIIHDGNVISLDWYIQRALGLSRHPKNNGLVVKGAGMDMGFSIVYDLGRVLHPDGVTFAKGTKIVYRGDTSGKVTDGGYAFNHQWL